MKNYKESKYAYYNIQYHLLFCIRLRRKVFKNEAVVKRFTQLVYDVATEHEFEVLDLNIKLDHVYIKVDTPPLLSPNDILAKIRFETSRILISEFDELESMPNLWTRKYVASIEPIDEADASEFVNMQPKR